MPTSPENNPRFHVFLIDLGWHTEVAQGVHDNLGVIRACLGGCPLFVLTPEQSLKVLRRDPHLIGSDPCLIVHDLRASEAGGQDGYHGFRLSLGRAKDSQQALRLFQDFIRFVAMHLDSTDIQREVGKKLRREGLAETIELLHKAI